MRMSHRKKQLMSQRTVSVNSEQRCRHCVKVLLGDFSAHLRSEDIYRQAFGFESLHENNKNNGV